MIKIIDKNLSIGPLEQVYGGQGGPRPKIGGVPQKGQK